MALTARVEKNNPNTLPADFSEWDRTDLPATLPEDFNEFDAHPQEAETEQILREPDREQTDKSVGTDVLLQPTSNKQLVSDAEIEVSGASAETHQTVNTETGTRPKVGLKTLVATIASAVVLVLLLVVSVLYFRSDIFARHGNQSPAPQAQPNLPEQTGGGQSASRLKPSPEVHVTAPSPGAPAVPTLPTPLNQTPKQVDSMNSQLNAPVHLPRNFQSAAGPQEPALNPSALESFGRGGADPVKTVFETAKAPQVKEDAKPVSISSGVAAGRLLSKSIPVYPEIAKAARVSGTVVVSAVISKGGSPQSVRPVSGPVMLRQAAVDAVKTWRYRPYLLNNEPTDVETTINVIFSINQ